MAFTQQTFMGASIRHFRCSLGWGGQVSSLTIGLVEDKTNGDNFDPLPMGAAAFFTYGNFTFNGIFQSYTTNRDQGGNPLFEVTLNDPRALLEGAQLILKGYNGSTHGVPNLLNVYGYLEKDEFGASQINETGLPWLKVKNAISALTSKNTAGAYGGPLLLHGHQFTVDLSELPSVPGYYRVGGGESMSILEFISDICAAGISDFFVTMGRHNANRSIIKVKTVSRKNQPVIGTINQFVNRTAGATSKKAGLEFRNEATGKFVVGGNESKIWGQFYNGQTEEDATIWPFWGFDELGNVILGEGINDDHKFTVDSRAVNAAGIGGKYTTNVGELRAAASSQDSWESYLSMHNEQDGPHKGKADKIGLITRHGQELINFLSTKSDEELKKFSPAELQKIKNNLASITPPNSEEGLKRIYEFVKSLATDFYGKKFMVSIPFLMTKKDPDTEEIILSQEVDDSGFIDEEDWLTAINQNLLPFNIDRLTNQDGKIEAYVRFNNAHNLDFSELNPDDVIRHRTYAFVKCNAIDIVFLDKENRTYPRAVIELAGPVKIKEGNDGGTDLLGLMKEFFNLVKAKNTGKPYSELTDAEKRARLSEVQGIVREISKKFNTESLFYEQGGRIVSPDLAGVPLKSKIKVYGPYYAVGAQGKIEFEQDDSLVPWNYGGFSVMDSVAEAKVSEALSNMQQAENGSIELPGAPALSLGSALIAGGPTVTNMTVSAGAQGGVRTVYNMQTFTPQFGKMAKYNADRLTKMSNIAQNMRRSLRQSLRRRPLSGNKFYARREKALKAARNRNASSHMMIVSDVIQNPDDTRKANTMSAPLYNIVPRLGDDYTDKAGVTMDGLFRPFTTDVDATGMPHYEEPEDKAATPTRKDLDPFDDDMDMMAIVRGNEAPDIGINNTGVMEGPYRPMGLRAPLVLVGWGRDTDGQPFPNDADAAVASGGIDKYEDADEEDKESFIDDYRKRMDLWKAGPVEMNWDRERKLWVTGGADIKLVKVIESGSFPVPDSGDTTDGSGLPRTVYYAEEYGISFEEKEGEEASIASKDKFLHVANFRRNIVQQDTYYLAIKVGGKYVLDNQAVFLEDM